MTLSVCSLFLGSGLREIKKTGEGISVLLQPHEKLASQMGVSRSQLLGMGSSHYGDKHFRPRPVVLET